MKIHREKPLTREAHPLSCLMRLVMCLVCLYTLGAAPADTTVAPINDTGVFAFIIAKHDILEVDSGAAIVTAKSIQMLQGDPNSNYYIVPAPNNHVHQVAKIDWRKGPSFYKVLGTYVGAPGAAGPLGRASFWYANYANGPARVFLSLRDYVINPGAATDRLTVTLIGANPNTNYSVDLSLVAGSTGSVSAAPNPVTIHGRSSAVVSISGGPVAGGVTIIGKCTGFQDGTAPGYVASAGDPSIVVVKSMTNVRVVSGPPLWGAARVYNLEVEDTTGGPYPNGTLTENFSNVGPAWQQPNGPQGGASSHGAYAQDINWFRVNHPPTALDYLNFDQTWTDKEDAAPHQTFTLNTMHLAETCTSIVRTGPGT